MSSYKNEYPRQALKGGNIYGHDLSMGLAGNESAPKIKHTLFLCLNLFSVYGFSKLELSSFVVWVPHIAYFPFFNLREQTLEKSLSLCH